MYRHPPPGASAPSVLVVIPARLAAARLPNKPLVDLRGEPMIVHVWRRAMEAGIGRVAVACGDSAIARAIEKVGGDAVMTAPDLPSGTDRVTAALGDLDPDGRHGIVVNLQGDMPTLHPPDLKAVVDALVALDADVATLATPTDDPEERIDPNCVKAVVAFDPDRPRLGRALYFTRATAPSGPGPVLHHIGVYAFRRDALLRFAALPPSPLEKRERLEQLRALEAGMTVGVALVESAPRGVDTPADLEHARRVLAERR